MVIVKKNYTTMVDRDGQIIIELYIQDMSNLHFITNKQCLYE